jgi:hypothetical protein
MQHDAHSVQSAQYTNGVCGTSRCCSSCRSAEHQELVIAVGWKGVNTAAKLTLELAQQLLSHKWHLYSHGA